MRLKTVAMLLAVTLFLVLSAPVLAAVPTHMTFPLNYTMDDPSLSEPVQITGELYGINAIGQDGGGGVHGQMHFSSRGLKGTGLETGTSYKLVTLYTSSANGVLPPGDGRWENTVIERTLLIGRGKDNMYVLCSTYHITYNANGVLTVVVE